MKNRRLQMKNRNLQMKNRNLQMKNRNLCRSRLVWMLDRLNFADLSDESTPPMPRRGSQRSASSGT
jgi:hypothetical protein